MEQIKLIWKRSGKIIWEHHIITSQPERPRWISIEKICIESHLIIRSNSLQLSLKWLIYRWDPNTKIVVNNLWINFLQWNITPFSYVNSKRQSSSFKFRSVFFNKSSSASEKYFHYYKNFHAMCLLTCVCFAFLLKPDFSHILCICFYHILCCFPELKQEMFHSCRSYIQFLCHLLKHSTT